MSSESSVSIVKNGLFWQVHVHVRIVYYANLLKKDSKLAETEKT